MLIAVLSDSHDNIWNLNKILKMAVREGAEMLIHCGDFCAPFVFGELAVFGGDVHCVFGNVDGDKLLMADFAYNRFSNIRLHGDLGELDAGGRKIGFVHSPKIGRALAAGGGYDAVFYGHSHEAKSEKVGNCLLVNPGEVMGRINEPSFCLYDTDKAGVRHLKLK